MFAVVQLAGERSEGDALEAVAGEELAASVEASSVVSW